MRLTQAIGDGLLAGTVGTAAMTLSSTIEMKLRRRGPSTVPARAAARVLGVEPTSARERERLNTVAHWAYGIGWGAARGEEVAVDALHHLVYAGVTSAACDVLERCG